MPYYVICFRENFLNLDIYYKYLTVEEIYQQPAFEFLSLLSEVNTLSTAVCSCLTQVSSNFDVLLFVLFNISVQLVF